MILRVRAVRVFLRGLRLLGVDRCDAAVRLLHHLLMGLLRIRHQRHVAVSPVLGHDLDDARGVVDLGYQVDQYAPNLSDRLRLVVDVVIRRRIALALPLLNGDAAALVGWHAQLGLILAGHAHQILPRDGHALDVCLRHLRRRLTLWARDRPALLVEPVIDQHRPVLDVGGRPLLLAALDSLDLRHIRALGL